MSRRNDKLMARCRQPQPWRISVRRLTSADARLLVEGLRPHGIEARVLEGEALGGKASLFQALARAFAFPDWFGHNWDALLDCLSDFHWLPAQGYVCVLRQADRFKAADREAHRIFQEVCRSAAERMASRSGAPFFKLVESGS